jgi:hypothetical protein
MGTKQFDNYADLITFTRASGATYLDSDGVLKTASTNIPRIEYDADGNRLGLLVEEQRTNYISYSDFSSGWNANLGGVITANQAEGLDKTQSMALLETSGISSGIFAGSANRHTVSGAGEKYTLSVVIKHVSGGTQLRIRLEGAAFTGSIQGIVVDFSDGSFVSNSNVAPDAYEIKNYGNGFYKINITGTTVASGDITPVFYGNINEDADFYIGMIQLEAGSFPTSYIPTSGSTATRAADSASITGADFKKWFNADEGTLVVEAAGLRPDSQLNSLYHISDGTIANRFAAYSGTAFHFYVVANGATQVNIDAGTGAQGVYSKYAQSYAINDFAAVIDGGSVGTDSSGILPNVSQIVLSGGSTTSDVNSNYIKSIKYYPRRLTNAQLQELTQ